MCPNGKKTFSIQIVIAGSDNQIIQVPAFGKFHAKMDALWFVNNNSTHSLIQLKSPQFRLKYPSGALLSPSDALLSTMASSAYPIFVTTPQHQIGGLNGAIEWETDLQGQIELQMIKLSGDAVDASDYCVMNINLTPVDM